MSNFSEQPPSNRGVPTFESDPITQLFSAEYVFGEPVLAIENDPGASAIGTAAPSTDEPSDVTSEPEPPAAPTTQPTQGNGQWYQWPAGYATFSFALPNGAAIKAVWFPSVSFIITISPGAASGSVLYVVQYAGAELVPIPGAHAHVTLSRYVAPPTYDLAVVQWVATSGTYPLVGGAGYVGGTAVVTLPNPPKTGNTLLAILCVDTAGEPNPGHGEAPSANPWNNVSNTLPRSLGGNTDCCARPVAAADALSTSLQIGQDILGDYIAGVWEIAGDLQPLIWDGVDEMEWSNAGSGGSNPGNSDPTWSANPVSDTPLASFALIGGSSRGPNPNDFLAFSFARARGAASATSAAGWSRDGTTTFSNLFSVWSHKRFTAGTLAANETTFDTVLAGTVSSYIVLVSGQPIPNAAAPPFWLYVTGEACCPSKAGVTALLTS